MTIENVQPSDAKRLLEIYGPYVSEMAVSFEYEIPSEEEFATRIESILARYPYIKATDASGTILGYAYAGVFKGRSAYDWSVETTVYVDRGFHGQGVGRALYEELETRLKDMGIQNMNACIAMPQTEEDPYLTKDSYRFHKKMGFETVGLFHNCAYKYDRWYHMIWMEKMIGNHEGNPAPVAFGK